MPHPAEPTIERSCALIIATASYADRTLTRLRAPGSDAEALAEVLRDEAIGGFEVVETILEQTADAVRRHVVRFCRSRRRDDLALVYLSCHGILDDRGALHYAATDTERDLLEATAIEASWLNRQLESCRARRQILILDCCHSGAFARDAKGDGDLALIARFPKARGRVVLTASGATEYAFEGQSILGEGAAALFTSALVDGLRSGDADHDGDGLVGIQELYDHAAHRVRERDPRQNPALWVEGGEGTIVVARSPRGPRVTPRPLPESLELACDSAMSAVRVAAVAELEKTLDGPDRGRALTARERLEQMVAGDLAIVADTAREVLVRHGLHDGSRREPPPPPPPAPPAPPLREPPPPRRWRRIAVAGLLIVAAATAAVALASPGDNPPAAADKSSPVEKRSVAPVDVGAIYPLADANSSVTQEVLNGVRFAADYINHGHDRKATLGLKAGQGLPGLGGAKLNVIAKRTTRCAAGTTIGRLVRDDHVSALIGSYESTLTLRGIDAADELHVPLVNDGSTGPSLTDAELETDAAASKECPRRTDPRPSPWFFRPGASDAEAAARFLDFLSTRPGGIAGVHRVAILHENEDIFGETIAASMRQQAESRGLRVKSFPYRTILGTAPSRGTCDTTAQRLVTALRRRVHEIETYVPDIVFAIGYRLDAVAAVQAMREEDYVPPALLAFGSGFLDDTFIDDVHKPGLCGLPDAEPAGIVARASWSSDAAHLGKNAEVIADLFHRRYPDEQMTSKSAVGFTAMMTLARAINAARSRDPAKIRDALSKLDIPSSQTIMPWRGIRFDRHGENPKARFVLEQILAGKYRVVYPKTAATTPPVWPLAMAPR